MKNAMFVVITMGIWGILVATALADTIVTFPDPALDALIRENINKPTGDILDTDLSAEGFRSFSAYNSGITNISGLEYCVNLEHLYLTSNEIEDIRPLANLRNLRCLYLDDNKIANISAIAGLTNLYLLDVSSNQLMETSALADLVALRSLSLQNNQITDLNSLGGLSDLTELRLQSNQLEDIAALSDLISLKILYLQLNKITNIDALSDLTNLKRLFLQSNQIADISAVAQLAKLEELCLQSNEITDIGPIAGLSKLYSLNLQSNHVADIGPVSGLDNLALLWLSSNQITDISAISALSNISYINLSDNYVADISAVESLRNLMYLNLSLNQIEEISALTRNSAFSYNRFVDLCWNPLGSPALCEVIPILIQRGVSVSYIGGCSMEGEGEGEGGWEEEGEVERACQDEINAAPHSADLDQNWRISLSELMRVIQFYNSGGYRCDPFGEDGYHAGAGDLTGCDVHDSDYNPVDGQINLSELLRITQYYNAGGYSLALRQSEDGFSPEGWSPIFELSHHFLSGNAVLQGQSAAVTLSIQYTGSDAISALAVTECMPEGWQFDGWISGAIPNLGPVFTVNGEMNLVWFFVPTPPFSVTYRAIPADDALGCFEFRGQIVARGSEAELCSAVSASAIEVIPVDQ